MTAVDLVAPARITVVRWKCPHCSRSRSSRKAAVEHIGRCWFNPANRTCRTCEHWQGAVGPCGEYGCNGCGSEAFCRIGKELGAYDNTEHCPDWLHNTAIYQIEQESR
jgi:hypothetical protein